MITATAPVRVCDLGGWTDTWWGGPGRVLNIAVGPGVTVRIDVGAGAGATHFVDGGDDPMLQAAALRHPPAPGTELVVAISSAVPPGASTGTSAAVLVALLAGLAAAAGRELDPAEAAGQAHLVETEDLGRESGLQDQLAAAHGGINWICVDDYPGATAERMPDWPGLDDHLTTVYLGAPHDSSAVHREVIGRGRRGPALDRLRAAAELGRRAVRSQDLAGLAQAMTANTDAQAELHPDLVSAEARAAWRAARGAGALGWKVNGAGGAGGSVTVATPPGGRVEAAIRAAGPQWTILPLKFSPGGLRVVSG